MNSTLSDISETAAVPVHVDMNPPVGPAAEQISINELMRANGIIDHLQRTSPVILGLRRRLREEISEYERSVVHDQLRQEFEVALHQGGVSPGMVHHLAVMFAHNTVRDIQMVLARHGDSIVVYFLCKTVKGIYKLGQMITSGFMHAVFTVVIHTTAAHTTIDVYVRADEYNLRLLCLSAPKQKGRSLFRHTHLISDSYVSPHHNTCLSLFRHTHLTSDSCVSPHHNTKVCHSSDTHT